MAKAEAAVKEKPPAEERKADIQTENQQVAVPNQTGTEVADANDYGEYSGAGFEGTTQDDYTIPIMDILQSNSPEIASGNNEDPNAKPGNFIIRSLGIMLPGRDLGTPFTPCYTQHVFVEWRPRESGGGIVNTFQPNDPIVMKARQANPMGRIKLSNGNDLVETYYMYSIVQGPDGLMQTVVPFTSTKIPIYKATMSKARTIMVPTNDGRRINPPTFAHRYRFKTVQKKNAKGTWFNYAIPFDGATATAARLTREDPFWLESVALYQLAKDGAARIDTSKAEAPEHEDQSPQASADVNSPDIPF